MDIIYKQIINDISGICFSHSQINSFGFGDISQITNDIETKKEPKYKRVYVIPGNVQLLENRVQTQLNIIVMDILNSDLSNQENVMSDTLEVARDIYTVLHNSYEQQFGYYSIDYQPQFNANIVPFLERFDTILGGWTLQLTIEHIFNYDVCVLPFGNDLYVPNDPKDSSYMIMLNFFRSIGESHPQINSYQFGDIPQITNDILNNDEPDYTRFYVNPGNTILNNNEVQYQFNLYVLDKLNVDLSNRRDVMSDTLEIMKDIFVMTYRSEYEALFTPTIEPLIDNFDGVLAGWKMTITISIPFNYNRCVIPVINLDGITWGQLDKEWNEVNNNWDNV